jgi:RNA polymerase sigma factor (sigma-70 family)
MAFSKTSTGCHTDSVKSAARVFAEHGDFIRAVIGCKVKNKERADDLFQDLFLSLVFKPLPLDIRNTKSYLYRVITNYIADATSRVDKYQNRLYRYAEHRKRFTTQHIPENSLIELEEMNKMVKLIEDQLPPSEAQAVVLRYRNHHSTKETAEKMNVNSRSVSRYVSVGLSKIRHFLRGQKGNYNDCA